MVMIKAKPGQNTSLTPVSRKDAHRDTLFHLPDVLFALTTDAITPLTSGRANQRKFCLLCGSINPGAVSVFWFSNSLIA